MAKQLYRLDPNERILHKVKRHVIGVIPVVATAVIVAVVLIAVLVVAGSMDEEFGVALSNGILTLIGAGLLALVGLSTWAAIFVYFRNELIITTESVIVIKQHSLFGRDVSQMSLDDSQDVTVKQRGLASILHYGTLTLETPGEKENFEFKYAPRPHQLSQTIIDASEKFIEMHPEGGQFRPPAPKQR